MLTLENFEEFKVGGNVFGGKEISYSVTCDDAEEWSTDELASTKYANMEEAQGDGCDTLSCRDNEYDRYY
ncbi:MAG: hypothetical protein L6Q97_02230 [Thermoanaerobaculia bacterium]|nr:hypothetical protein [Thermoanaerobaculia bacterium]